MSFIIDKSEDLLKSYIQEVIQDVDGLKMYSIKYYSCVSPSVNLITSLYRMLFHKAFVILISIPKRIGKNSSLLSFTQKRY